MCKDSEKTIKHARGKFSESQQRVHSEDLPSVYGLLNLNFFLKSRFNRFGQLQTTRPSGVHNLLKFTQRQFGLDC